MPAPGKELAGMRSIQAGMYKGVKVLFLALALLVGLASTAPAFAFGADHASAVSGDCCIPPPPSCGGPGATCALQQACQPGFASAAEQAQIPLFTAAADQGRREPVLPPVPRTAVSAAAEPHAGPPSYLRFHRFLL